MSLIAEAQLQERGQVTIPAKLRKLLGLKSDTTLLLYGSEKEIIIRPKIKNPLQFAGMLGKETGVRTVEELLLKYKRFS
ncbi:AbrB/MazE/SpoVT family DNA-binding domain-containing protein [Candidatus Woesearchaeota archaeon]|nr:AbrB/MazE/SpoVT family DNA-binding domain-containing protein [Candidatus Woesearchaeota archaeon]